MKLQHKILGKSALGSWTGKVQRIVIKLGTGLLTDAQGRLSLSQIEQLVAQVAALHRQKKQIIIVSSGAIGAGMAEFGFKQRPKRLDELQAAAAIGQSKLMAIYDQLFGKFGITVAQVLLTHDDLNDRTRHLNAHNTLAVLLAHGVVPIINENDTVSVDEIKFGDNDRLGALTATLVDADLLVILSHIEGLYKIWGTTQDRRSLQVIPVVEEITPDIEALAGGTNRTTSVGGMKSKISAAKIVTRAGIPMIIANGDRSDVLARILNGDGIGTVFLPQTGKLASRKRWIAFFQRPAGTVVVDNGAKQALCENGRSLLAKGVLRIQGKIATGDVVSICDPTGVEFARGLVKAMTGVMVHRNDLVIL